MFSRMLKFTTVFLAMIAVFLMPMGVLSEFSTSPDTEQVFNEWVCTNYSIFFPDEASVDPKKDADGNPTKACSDYKDEGACEDATVEYDITEAGTCNAYPPYPLDKYNQYWWCETEKEIVPNGSCNWESGACIDDTSYEGDTLYYTSKCTTDRIDIPIPSQPAP